MLKSMKRLSLSLCWAYLLAALLAPLQACAQADDYPSRPVTFIVPFTAGSSTETEARVYTGAVSESLGRPFLVDFKPGAGSTIGANYVAKAAPDGYTVLFFSSSFSTSAALYKNLPYDPIKDFAPVSLLSQRPMVLVVNPALPVRSLQDYVAYARQNQGNFNLVTTGNGSAPHFAGALLHSLIGTQPTFIHYKGNQMLLDVIAGRAQAVVTTLETATPIIKSGKLRPLGVSTLQRSPVFPAIPTIAEQGLPGYEYSGELGVMAPRATPRTVVAKLSAELIKATRSADVARKLAGSFMVGSTPEQLAEHLTTSIRRFQALAREAGIQSEE